MIKYLLAISTSVYMLNISAQELIYENYYKADSLFTLINNNYTKSYTIKYSGTNYSVGHNSTPEEQKMYSIIYEYKNSNEDFIINKKLIYNSKSYFSKLTYSEDSCSYNDYGEHKIKVESSKEKEFPYFYSPRNILKVISKNKPSLHFVNDDVKNYRLGFNNSYGNKFYVIVDKKTNLINKLLQLKHDDLYGDSYKEIIYSNYKDDIPYNITVNDNQILNKELHLDSVLVEKQTSDVSSVSESISIEELYEGMFLVKLNDYNNKLLVTEYKDFLAVYEAPINVSVGNKIIMFLKKHFKNKEIKYCFLSHHHPDHAGAIGSFSEINSKIITTKGNIEYYNKISKSIHTLSENSFHPSNDKINYLIIDSLDEKTFFKTSSIPVVVYENGVETNHTNEFLCFYFPKQKLLFVGDLVIFPQEKIMPQKQRALSVYNLIKSKKLKVDRIYTGWPLKHQKEFGTITDLKNSLLKSYPNLK